MVGAGVVGLCTALYCAYRGWRVTVLERSSRERDACSFGNTGLVVPSHFIPLAAPGAVGQGLKWLLDPASPFYMKPRASWELVDWALKFWRSSNAAHVKRAAPLISDLALASRACFEELAGSENDIQLSKRGVLMLCRTQHGVDEEAHNAEYARQLGMPAEVLDAAQTAALDPNVRMDVIGSVHYPMDASVAPDRLVAGLERRVHEQQVELAWNTEVTGWRTENGAVRAIRSSRGDIEADEFVIAAGSWSSDLARDLHVRLPMQAGKGYSLTLKNPVQQPAIPALLTEARVAVNPMPGALRFAGTMEIAGLNLDVNPIRVRGIIDAVPRYYPEFKASDFDGVQAWRGLRPCSPDGLPYVGRTKRYSNLVVAAGHAMLGITLGPVTGKLAAQVIAGEKPDLDISPLSPDRYN